MKYWFPVELSLFYCWLPNKRGALISGGLGKGVGGGGGRGGNFDKIKRKHIAYNNKTIRNIH